MHPRLDQVDDERGPIIFDATAGGRELLLCRNSGCALDGAESLAEPFGRSSEVGADFWTADDRRLGWDSGVADPDGSNVGAEDVLPVQRVPGGNGRIESLKVDEPAALLVSSFPNSRIRQR